MGPLIHVSPPLQARSDLTALDGHVFLMEYVEEHPIMLSNIGMGAKRVLYYRRKTQGDTKGK